MKSFGGHLGECHVVNRLSKLEQEKQMLKVQQALITDEKPQSVRKRDLKYEEKQISIIDNQSETETVQEITPSNDTLESANLDQPNV